jgi:hypothetical protein
MGRRWAVPYKKVAMEYAEATGSDGSAWEEETRIALTGPARQPPPERMQ